jgi:hypothetical protein
MKVLLIFILSLSPILAQQSPQPSPAPVETSQEQQQLGTSKESNSATSQPAVKSGDIAKENDSTKDQSGQDGHKSTPDWITWLTGVIAVAAVLQFIVFCFQAHYMYVGLSLTKQAADAATQAVQVLNRARIRVEPAAFQDIENPNSRTFKIVWYMTNTGPTTGYVFEQRNDYCITDQPLPVDAPYTDKPLPRHIHIGPDQRLRISVDSVQKSTLNLSNVAEGKLWVYAFGYIRYKDEFGVEHETRYAVRHVPGSPNAPTLVTIPGYNSST